MALQGYDTSCLPGGGVLEMSEHQLADLAGNAFSVNCAMAAILALLTSLRFNTESEDEELDQITSSSLGR
ncbi:unnamed protein product [Symbiodinium pilosum]|uniref:Uncharacterized protein n=1 Tax=Symbiodinium pilosum TaxID=2952 RepID=A0A812K308_SYMPI|nr:unnamed protein product [Symbiodinium pilosum]